MQPLSSLQVYTALALDPKDPSTVYAGGAALSKSTDGGTTWTKLTGADSYLPAGRNVQQIGVDPFDSNVILVYIVSGGIIRSADRGATWAQVVLPTTGFAFDLGLPGVIYATSFGVLKSTDHGAHWTALTSTGSGAAPVYPDPFQPGTIYSSADGYLFKSTDDGKTAKVIQPGTYNPFFAPDLQAGMIYASFGTHIGRTSDGFAHVETVGPATTPEMRIFAAGCTCADPKGPPRIYAVTDPSASDLFVAKLDPQGNVLYASYLGGSSIDGATAIAVDSAGNVYITGSTASADFPVTKGAYLEKSPAVAPPGSQSLPAGASFLLKLNPQGDIVYSTYFASGKTNTLGLAVDGTGSVYLTGMTNGDLPVTPGVYQSSLNPVCGSIPCFGNPGTIVPIPQTPVENAFVTRFSADGSRILFSTYIGAISEQGRAIAVDSSGTVYLAGGSIVYELSGDGSALIRSTALKGGGIASMALDSKSNIYVAGIATTQDFYQSWGAFQKRPPALGQLPTGYPGYSNGDAFVAKLTPDLSITYSSVFGGEATDGATGIAVDNSGQVTAVGNTSSRTFPLTAPAQSTFNTYTGFATRLTADASSLVYSTYVGDQEAFSPIAVALDRDGNAVFAGYSSNVPGNSAAPSRADGVWVVRLDQSAPSSPRIDNVVNVASQFGGAIAPNETVSIKGAGFVAGSVVLFDGTAVTPLSLNETELAVAVPKSYQTSPGGTATVQIQAPGGAFSNRILLPIALTAPGLFSADGSGWGQGYILNADGTLNSPSNPTPEGGIITIFATGVGATSLVNQSAVTAQMPAVFVDGFYAYGVDSRIGPVPGFPGDVYQIKVYVPHPADLASVNPNLQNFKMPPTVPVRLDIGGASSEAGLTLSIK